MLPKPNQGKENGVPDPVWLSDKERDLMIHALGLSPTWGGRQRRWAYRNRFVVTQGSPDDAAWSALVKRGMAVARRYALAPEFRFYEVTEAGIAALGVLSRVPRKHRCKA